jgi:dienelactone hydrolase
MGGKSDRADTKGSGQAYTRQPFLIVHREAQRRKDIYGSIGDNIVLQAQHLRPVQDSKCVIIAMHPIGSPGYLPMFSGLARAGNHVVACATRYANGDAALQMENVLLDLGACVRDARERLGYESVVLAGWSGGGSLMAGYQAESEKPQITQTAAGEPTALADTELLPADAVLLLAAHRSRHHLVTDFLDASITDEANPERHKADLDLYGTDASAQPPYTAEFLRRYRTAQRERNGRISAYAKERLEDLRRRGRPDEEHCFLVQGTMADPRWLDPTVEPNDRQPGWTYMGDPKVVNNSPAGLARYTTTRSWLSQWSLEDAQVDAIEAGPRISVPVLVMAMSRDDACPTSHTTGMYGAIAHDDKELVTIEGADHYLSGLGQRSHITTAVDLIGHWLDRHHLGA